MHWLVWSHLPGLRLFGQRIETIPREELIVMTRELQALARKHGIGAALDNPLLDGVKLMPDTETPDEDSVGQVME